MARKQTLSPSKITTYLACPVKFGWTYLDPRGKWYLKSKSYYSFGSTLHRVLERFHDSGDTGVTTVGAALQAYEDTWIDAGYSSAEEMAEAFGEGREIIEKYVGEVLSKPDHAKTLFVEKSMRLDLGPFVLIGRIDRLDEHDDGTIEIIDYKSGRGKVSDDEVAADLAMGCYQLMVKAQYPDRPVKATIKAIRAGVEGSSMLSDVELDQLRSDLIMIGTEILAMEMTDRIPKRKPLCEHCDFLPMCTKHPDFS